MAYPNFQPIPQAAPMRIHIFDVEHGECNAIETPTGDLMLIGVGHNSSTNWRPSDWVRRRNQQPSCIVLNNLDRDHLSDLGSFEPSIRPVTIRRNDLVHADWVEALKVQQSGVVHPSVATALHWMRNVFTGSYVTLDYGIEKRFFNHPPTKFQDTNNLSVVTFLRYNNCGILFPGDLECAGWLEFLNDALFVDCLRRTNILVASHHGREGGYCKDIFAYCRPDIIVISDKSIAHDTQDHSLYAQHSSGLYFGTTLRRVLTTRCDGKITIEVPATGSYVVKIRQSY